MRKRTLIISVRIVSPIAQWLLDLFAGHFRVNNFLYSPVGSFTNGPVLSTWATFRVLVFAGWSVMIDAALAE